MNITTKFKMDLARRGVTPRLDAVQGDENTRAVQITLYANGTAWEPPEGTTAAVAFKKPDGTRGLYDHLPDGDEATTLNGNVVTATLAPQVLTCPGAVQAAIVLYDTDLDTLSTFQFNVIVEANPAAGEQVSNSYYYVQNLEQINEIYEMLAAQIESHQEQLDTQQEQLDVLNAGGLQIKDEVIKSQIDGWLDEHPEATTTVQDDSLTVAKFTVDDQKKILNAYVTPQQYGAVGDGATDDTAAIQAATDYSYQNGVSLFFPAGKYKITQSIDVHDKTYWYGAGEFMADDRSEILSYVEDGATLIDSTTASTGKRFFKGLKFTRKSGQKGTLFDLFFSASEINNCCVLEFGVVFAKNIKQVTTIHHNQFISVMEAFCTGKVVDTQIHNNYINGYRPFNVLGFTGAIDTSQISNNYVDYFKTFFDCSGGVGGTVISGNSFDFVYRVFNAIYGRPVNGCTIAQNNFYNISNCVSDTVSGFVNADAEMLAIEPLAILSGIVNEVDGVYSLASTYNGVVNSAIIGNRFGDAKVYFESPANGVIMSGNMYGYTAADITLKLGFDSSNKYYKCSVDIMHNAVVDTLPGRMVGNNNQYAFPFNTVIYHNKPITYIPDIWPLVSTDTVWNNHGWYDALGNEVVE